MKNKIIVLMMALMLVELVAGTAAAADWEMTSGMAITNVTLDKWNDSVEDANAVLTNYPDAEEVDEIERVPMFYLGAKNEFKENWVGTLRYEYIFGAVEGEANGGADNVEMDVDLHGLALLTDYQLNNNWSLGGGVGFYTGNKYKRVEGPTFNSLGAEVEDDYDLSAVSYRLGVGYDRSFARNWSFNAGVDYLYMEIDDEDEGNVYSAGFSYNAGLTYSF